MNQDNVIKDYVNGNIRPTDEERKYVKAKYAELREVLSDGTGNVFRSGSFARHTATTPIHDLDVIWVDESYEALDEPYEVLQELATYIEQQYRERGYPVPEIEIQSHSVTLQFNDIDGGFAIDVVPAIKADEDTVNEYGDPIFMVPEIIRLNHHHREEFYAKRAKDHQEVRWLLTDPKGYIEEAKQLDETTRKNYRATVRIVKAWRSKMKDEYKDDWKLKSFHAEQICAQIFTTKPDLSIAQGLTEFYDQLPGYITNAPLIEDRAYASDSEDKYIDQYMTDQERVTDEMKSTIIDQANKAAQQVAQLASAPTPEGVERALRQLTQRPTTIATSPQTHQSAPRPYREY